MTPSRNSTNARRRRHAPVGLSSAVIGALCLAGPACVSTSEPTPPPDAIHVGTVLPFSGPRAASGVALESALRLAIDQVNQVGLGGRALWLDVADSHSDDVRGSANALELINRLPMPFFIGTEEPKIAYEMTSAVKVNQMVHLMPGLTSAQFHDPSASAAWFRLSPSVTYVSCALAKHMLSQGIKKASLLLDPDDYSGNFAANFGHVFTSKGGVLLPTMQIGSTAYADLLTTVARLSPDATVLVTSPSAAAGFLQEWAVRGKPVKLYLGPTLNNPELLRNVPVGVLEDMSGVSADLGPQSPSFDAFFEGVTGAPPIAGSHYYYDAVAMLSLAAGRGIGLTGTLPTPATMKEHMVSVTSAGGTIITYDRLAEGLGLLAQGVKVQYVGAAGVYVLNALGDSTLNRGAIWHIKGNEFQTIDYQQCDVSELQNGGT